MHTPTSLGEGYWSEYLHVSSGGPAANGTGGIIYAVDKQGQLLFFQDHNCDGTGQVDGGKVIGLGGWQQFVHLFSAGNGIIYAVNPDGQLLFYRDHAQDGTGDVNTPAVIGLGGWQAMRFLFSGGPAANGGGIIYAVPA